MVKAIKAYRAALDCSDTGTGKTVKAVEVARTLGLGAFVVAPKVTIPAWIATLHEQGVFAAGVMNYELLRTGRTPAVKKVRKSFQWTLPKDTLIIFDEVHKAKSSKSLNAKLLIAAKRQNYPILMLSATAAENPIEMCATGYALRLHNKDDFWAWAVRFGVVFDQWGGATFPDANRHHLTALNKLIFPARGHRVTRADLGAHFSKTSLITDPLDFGDEGAIGKLLSELEDEMDALNARIVGDSSASHLTKILRLRQWVELLKVPQTASMIDDLLAEGNSVAVFVNFNDTVEALSRRVAAPHVFLRGGQADTERTAAIDRFQSNQVRLILCNIAAGGVGVNLHDTDGRHPRVALISPTYNAKDLSQTLGRVDRVGAASDSIQRILIAANSIEEKIVAAALKKLENISLLAETPVLNTIQQMSITLQDSTPATQPAHATWGPSKLKMWAACPGWASNDGDRPVNEAAESGRRVHEALETGDWTPLTDWESWLAQQCHTAKTKLLARHGLNGSAQVHTEVRLNIDLGGGLSTFGTADLLVFDQSIGVMIDYKTGRRAVDGVADNWQAKAYATGAFQKFPQLRKLAFYFIIPQRDEIKAGEFHYDQMDSLLADLRRVITTAQQLEEWWNGGVTVLEDLLNPTDQVCNYCARVGNCPAVRTKAMQVAALYHGTPLDLPTQVHSSTASPEDLAKMLRLAPVLEAWASSVRFHATELAVKEGVQIPGFSLKERSGKRSITSTHAAFEELKAAGVTLDEFLSALDGSLPVSSFEELVGKSAPKGGKKKTITAALARLYEVGALSNGAPSTFLRPDD